jgi:hypothetical protein
VSPNTETLFITLLVEKRIPGAGPKFVVVSESAIWNLATLGLITIAVGYGYRLLSFLKDGEISKGYALSLCSLGAMWTTFLLRSIFSLIGIIPIHEFGVSIVDLGTAISAVFVVLSLRQSSIFWKVGRPVSKAAVREVAPHIAEYPLKKKLRN